MGIRSLLEAAAKPTLEVAELRRSEFVLNVILLGTIVLANVSLLIVLIDSYRLGEAYKGIAPERFVVIPLIFVAIYFLSRIGQAMIASRILISILYAAVTFVAYQWGVNLPTALLAYALILTMTAILLGTRAVFVLLVLVASTLSALNYLHVIGVLNPQTYWRTEDITQLDVVVYTSIMAVIVVITWLYNREIGKSLYRARRSESALKKERDSLEVKVDERTSQLKQAQLEKMMQMYRLAEFGRVASGLFHDLINPLNVVSLNLEHMQDEHRNNKDKVNPGQVRTSIAEALRGTKRMEKFVAAARRHVRHKQVKRDFALSEEIEQILPILDYNAKLQQVKVTVDADDGLHMYGDQIKFNQIVSNLITNAIDSYDGVVEKRRRQVEIQLRRIDDVAHLSVRDWGCGIQPDKMDEIFEPFYTTKDFEKGMGVGLHMVKENVEQEFGGSITVDSKPREGTTFIVTLPLRREPPST